MDESPRSGIRPQSAAWLAGLATAIGLLMFGYHYLGELANAPHAAFGPVLIDELTGAYSAVLLFPGIAWIARRFRIGRANWYATIPIVVLGAIAYTAIHTSLMWGSRSLLYPLFNFGHYDYGDMLYRYPMEGSQDLIVYAVVIGFVDFWDRMTAGRRAELRAADLQAQLAQAQLENLRLQLNPHFLFNTLNAISAVMYEDVRKADEMLAKLSDFLRAVLASSGVEQVPLAEELTIERMYVEIMTSRLERPFTFTVRVDEAARAARVPFMLLQPLIENSIRHASSDEHRATEIAVEAARRNGAVVLTVSDDGCGLPAAPRTDGVGLRLVRSRLQQLFGNSGGFELSSPPTGGTRATITFPYTATEEVAP